MFNFVPCSITFNEIIKYIVSFVDTTHFPLTEDKKIQIEKYMFSIKKEQIYIISLVPYSKFINDIDALVFLYKLLYKFEPINKEVSTIINNLLYVLLNHTIPLIISNKSYEQYSMLMINHLTKLVNEDITQKINEIKILSTDMANIKEIYTILETKVNAIQKENNEQYIKQNTKLDMLTQFILQPSNKNNSSDTESGTPVTSTLDKAHIYDTDTKQQLLLDSALSVPDNEAILLTENKPEDSFAPNEQDKPKVMSIKEIEDKIKTTPIKDDKPKVMLIKEIEDKIKTTPVKEDKPKVMSIKEIEDKRNITPVKDDKPTVMSIKEIGDNPQFISIKEQDKPKKNSPINDMLSQLENNKLNSASDDILSLT